MSANKSGEISMIQNFSVVNFREFEKWDLSRINFLEFKSRHPDDLTSFWKLKIENRIRPVFFCPYLELFV